MAEVLSIDEQIGEIQKEIFEKHKEIVNLRKDRPKEPISDYDLKDKDGNTVKLSELFGDNDELLIIHNMGKGCVYCTMWADSFTGITEMMESRMPFALVSPDDPSTMKEFAEPRGWNYTYISAHESDFISDLGFVKINEQGKKHYWPGASALVKENGQIYRVGKDYFGPGDTYCAPWHFYNLFPKGDNGWQPKYKY